MNAHRKSESLYSRSLIEASRDPMFTINPEGKITDINAASISITEVSREDLIGTDFFEYFTEPEKAREIYKQVFAEGFVADFPLTIHDGVLTDVLFNGSVYKDESGKVLGVVVVARDITDHKRIETELIKARIDAELATKNEEEARIRAENATKLAENAMKAKQRFLSNMSHEIRTPMNSIIGFTTVLLKSDLSENQKEYLNAIRTSGESLIVLINDILDLAKVEAGKMTFENVPFELISSVSAILHLFEIKTQEKNIELVKEYDYRIPEVLNGDPVRLHQIIINLLSNAVKFTNEGTITLSNKLLSEDNQKVTVEFSIADTGIGIEKTKINEIFETFHQATSDTTRLFGGTGLGLSIVKQLVELQGGTISIKSKINQGSVFSFILPFEKTMNKIEDEPTLLKLDKDVKNIKVLVVEDIILNQLLMKTILDDFGFDRDVAANGKIAIEKLKNNAYDIILMDLHMPEMNGFETTAYIRNIFNSEIPIIAITADVTTTDVDKCLAVGMNDYISKPINETLLYRKIIWFVKKRKPKKHTGKILKEKSNGEKMKFVDLTYLKRRTKSDPKLMTEMISLFIEQTPVLINKLKHCILKEDWNLLYKAIHKLIPSFSIMGISTDYENLARRVMAYSDAKEHTDEISSMVMKLEEVCLLSCDELKEELNQINAG